MNRRLGLVLGLVASCCTTTWADEKTHGVKVVSPDRFHLEAGDLSLGLSQDWRQPLPKVTRALIIVHGRLRNAQTYLHSGEDAAEHARVAANTLVIAPQFLNQADVKGNHLGNQVLRWKGNDWMAGEPSTGPGQISSYGALDQIIKHLGNRTLFPALKEIVVAGHSGGGQVVQRFALTGHDHPLLQTEGIRLRYVVANPSSYAYFSPQRPVPFDTASCPGFNDWKYGMQNLPDYVGDRGAQQLEHAYVSRDITYLLGQQDTDPNHPALDKGCEAEAQGAYRLIRGHHYFDYLKLRHPQLSHKLVEVPGVGHDGDKMFTSPEGEKVLFAQ
ncbi:alpha/beta hydrolase [Pseudomonas haemolytica]|uniref:Alpha/beta hydrolase n=1 Tax=Pseudomonas haemolytica TaxID=2600065 RepID=A0A5P1DI67_9PSED|nr:alpha/beta hydrolase [Pseudomonas haemolytica]MBJ2247985.1 alpha/beta hydrolase [Pseudomonas haemolytica]MBJ2274984.1 alpha/beta hydrolase [Pseudomonas haemolytica]MBK3449772.1 alpha/beta hydrolase [Pseudomonas haemolytica]MBK3462400.1 alpha/beta hydrolase [Pseudomonas haemolytica]MRJ23005.1 alpha/beta hydrolase [Pseudomonas haemolytica]